MLDKKKLCSILQLKHEIWLGYSSLLFTIFLFLNDFFLIHFSALIMLFIFILSCIFFITLSYKNVPILFSSVIIKTTKSNARSKPEIFWIILNFLFSGILAGLLYVGSLNTAYDASLTLVLIFWLTTSFAFYYFPVLTTIFSLFVSAILTTNFYGTNLSALLASLSAGDLHFLLEFTVYFLLFFTRAMRAKAKERAIRNLNPDIINQQSQKEQHTKYVAQQTQKDSILQEIIKILNQPVIRNFTRELFITFLFMLLPFLIAFIVHFLCKFTWFANIYFSQSSIISNHAILYGIIAIAYCAILFFLFRTKVSQNNTQDTSKNTQKNKHPFESRQWRTASAMLLALIFFFIPLKAQAEEYRNNMLLRHQELYDEAEAAQNSGIDPSEGILLTDKEKIDDSISLICRKTQANHEASHELLGKLIALKVLNSKAPNYQEVGI